jgi:DNA-binding NtrC family response regulator
MVAEAMAANGTIGPSTASRDTPTAVKPYYLQERAIIEGAIAAFGGNVAQAAAALEISPATIYRKLRTWEGDITPGL